MKEILNLILHLDHHLQSRLLTYGTWIYPLLFLVIFCETGLVVTPFLPGDSLLFAVGALAAMDQASLQLPIVIPLLIVASIGGDSANYVLGRRLGLKVFRPDSRWFNQKHLEETQAFYRKHGGKTILLARFMPIVRTFAPFVAGVGKMDYTRFMVYNVAGGILWVLLFVLGGYFFGNIPMVKNNFEFVILGIVVISLLPLGVRLIKINLSD